MDYDEKKPWRFTNSKNSRQTLEVTDLASARAFLTTLNSEQIQYWLVEQAGALTAEPLANCKILFVSEATGGNGELVLEMGEIGEGIKVINEPAAGTVNRRKHKRLAIRIWVTVFVGKEIYSGCTVNVSGGGLLFEGPLPRNFLNQDCRIVLSIAGNNMKLEFTGRTLDTSHTGSRIQFATNSPEANVKRLVEWVDKMSAMPGQLRID